jgi:hypothetical protein
MFSIELLFVVFLVVNDCDIGHEINNVTSRKIVNIFPAIVSPITISEIRKVST